MPVIRTIICNLPVCFLAGQEPEVVLRQFGEYFFQFCKRTGYDHMLRTLGGNLFEFTENLDALHSFLTLSYKVTNPLFFLGAFYGDNRDSLFDFCRK